MNRIRHTSEQIIRKLRTGEQLLNQGQTVAHVCRALEVSAQTYHRWQLLYGGMKASEAKRRKELEKENGRLKSFWQKQSYRKPCSTSLPRETSEPVATTQSPVCSAKSILGFSTPCLPVGGPEPQHPTSADSGHSD